jgi:hypothetical protein
MGMDDTLFLLLFRGVPHANEENPFRGFLPFPATLFLPVATVKHWLITLWVHQGWSYLRLLVISSQLENLT